MYLPPLQRPTFIAVMLTLNKCAILRANVDTIEVDQYSLVYKHGTSGNLGLGLLSIPGNKVAINVIHHLNLHRVCSSLEKII